MIYDAKHLRRIATLLDGLDKMDGHDSRPPEDEADLYLKGPIFVHDPDDTIPIGTLDQIDGFWSFEPPSQ